MQKAHGWDGLHVVSAAPKPSVSRQDQTMSKQKKLPSGMSVESLNRVYINELDRHSDSLIDEISFFLAKPISVDVTEVSIQVFPDEYGDGYTSVGLYLHGEVTKHTPFAEYVNDLPLIDVASYQEDISIPDLVVDLVKQWFAESWWKAGGWNYQVSATIGSADFGNGNITQLTKSC